jgi:L-threonylcarbamoyladenylate synthase
MAKALLRAVGKPLAAPSANLSGKPSSTQVEHVMEDFNGRVAAILDGGPSTLGLESTVLDVSVSPPVILRPGSISADMIEAVIQEPLGGTIDTRSQAPKAPGMKYRHYQPQGVITLIEGTSAAIVHHLQTLMHDAQYRNAAWIVVDEYAQTLQPTHLYAWGSLYEPATLASRLYALLRLMDQHQHTQIIMHGLLEDPLSQAVMNRLEKAATHRIKL